MDSESPLIILHLLEPGGGGTMRHVLDLASEQTRCGHQVHVIYSPLRLEPLFAPQIENLKNVTLHALPMRRAPHLSDITNLFSLIEILRRTQPDILHAHSTKAGMLARLARLARIFVKTKIIYTPHALMTLDPETSAIKKFAYGCYEKLLSPLMHRMIVLSSYEYDHAIALGIPRSKLVMGLNGIQNLPPADRKAIRRQWLAAENDVIVGFVGRLCHQKHPELTIAAFAKAQTESPNLKLVMIGEGELRSRCETLAHDLKVENQIIWLGAADAKEFYAGMDMLLITSRYEGMAYTFIEAIHAGLPIVTTPVGGSDSCVIHHQTGLIVPADINDLANAVLLLANDPTILDAMRFAARATARHFTLAHSAELHHQIYCGD